MNFTKFFCYSLCTDGIIQSRTFALSSVSSVIIGLEIDDELVVKPAIKLYNSKPDVVRLTYDSLFGFSDQFNIAKIRGFSAARDQEIPPSKVLLRGEVRVSFDIMNNRKCTKFESERTQRKIVITSRTFERFLSILPSLINYYSTIAAEVETIK